MSWVKFTDNCYKLDFPLEKKTLFARWDLEPGKKFYELELRSDEGLVASVRHVREPQEEPLTYKPDDAPKVRKELSQYIRKISDEEGLPMPEKNGLILLVTLLARPTEAIKKP